MSSSAYLASGVIAFSFLFSALLADTIQEYPPSLISNPYEFIPADAIRMGVEGTIRTEVVINSSGIVEKCNVLTSLSPYTDSITVNALQHCTFTPAISAGTPVQSSIEIELIYDPNSLVLQFGTITPDISGRIIARKNGKPLRNALVTVQFSDSAEDRSMQIPFTKFCSIVGNIPGQRFENDIFSTLTDLTGHFSFRLLPQGHFSFRAFNDKSEQIRIDSSFTGNRNINLIVFSEDFGELNNEYEIEVTAKDNRKSIIDINERQVTNGMTHSVGEIIKSQVSVRSSSQSKAKIIVRSASPYDNQYLIAGVPFYSPYHFGGYSFGETDGLMINTLKKIVIETDELAGRYSSVSGLLVKADPGIDRVSGKKKKRPELSIELGSASIDFLASIKPVNRAYQIGITAPNSYFLDYAKIRNHLDNEAMQGIGLPYSFSNVTFTAQSSGKSLSESFFSWFAFDAYRSYDVFTLKENVKPWGMASYTISSTGKLSWNLSMGGSHQYFADGKRTGKNAYLTTATISNSLFTFSIDEIPLGTMSFDLQLRGEGRQWRGEVQQRDAYGDLFSLNGKSEEGLFSFHGGIKKKIGDLIVKLNILLSSTIFEEKPVFTADPGLHLLYQPTEWDAGLNIGKITSYPDFRGVPDKSFRSKKISTIVTSLPVHCNKLEKVRFGIQPFVRWQDLCPQMNPEKLIWDTALTTILLAKGAEASCEMHLAPWISMSTNAVLTDANRQKHGKESIYEWESPYTVSLASHLTLLKERLHTYLYWQKRSGTFYYDFGTSQYKRLMPFDDYSISFQLRNKVSNERFFTRYDGYVTIENFLDFPSIRNYYWDKSYNKIPIISDRLFFQFGVKAAFRL
jgi:hypothetical protein